MPKDKISDYSSTANSNTDIAGINIDEGCAPSGINDAIRTLMAQLKTWQSGGQDVYIHPAGSASAPSITANGDTNTGIFFPAADTVGITTGGTERARVDSAGNLGLGVTPSAWGSVFRSLDFYGGWGSVAGSSDNMNVFNNAYYNGTNYIYKNNGYASRYAQSSGVHYWFNSASGTAGGTVSFTQAMTLDASGNLGVGTSGTLNAKFEVWGQTRVASSSSSAVFLVDADATSTNGVNLQSSYYGGAGYGPMKFSTGGAERVRIDTSGNLLVGTTNADETSGTGVRALAGGTVRSTRSGTNNTTSTLDVYSTGAGAFRFYVGMAGTVFATSTTISAISDIRFKENVRDLNVGLAEVMALQPRLYDWKEGKGQNIKNARGFIAQEFEEVFPDLIDEWRDPAPEGEEPYKSVRADLIPVLVKAIQEQQAIITQLQADVAALKG